MKSVCGLVKETALLLRLSQFSLKKFNKFGLVEVGGGRENSLRNIFLNYKSFGHLGKNCSQILFQVLR